MSLEICVDDDVKDLIVIMATTRGSQQELLVVIDENKWTEFGLVLAGLVKRGVIVTVRSYDKDENLDDPTVLNVSDITSAVAWLR